MNDYFYADGLETERLYTRYLTKDDIEKWAIFFEDPEAVEFHQNTENKSHAETAQQWIERQLERYSLNQYGHQALIDKKTNMFIGQCGLLLQDVEGVPEVEIGYHIFREYWGMGYAIEAAARFKDFGFENKQEDSLVSLIDVHNSRSQKVAMRNGMKREIRLSRASHEIFVYRIEREEWEKVIINSK